MLRVNQSKSTLKTGKDCYRQYASEALNNAYEAVTKDSMPIRKAANVFCVPRSTLFDRVKGNIKQDCTKSGPEPFLSYEEEGNLVQHIQSMASFGYGYSRREVVAIATDLAVYLGKKLEDDKPLSNTWFYNFLTRWPQLKVQKPRSLELQRAMATSEDTVGHYFRRLKDILDTYDLRDSPERIYNIDEKGLMENHTPPHVVGPSDENLIAVTTARSSTTTVIGGGNAVGMAIPPFFIFKGKRLNKELLVDSTPGTSGTVSDSGWSNGDIFQRYLSDHFVKYAVSATAEKPLLLLYDGHRSHISVPLIRWAKERHIILFVLPAHTSHVLQPMDVACFGPFQKIYNNLRHNYMRDNATSGVSKESVCSLGCKAYTLALTSSNLRSSFKKCGIYPFSKDVLKPSTFQPAKIFENAKDGEIASEIIQVEAADMTSSNTGTEPQETSTSTGDKAGTFFANVDTRTFKKSEPKKKRSVLSAIVGGKAITEDAVLDDIIRHQILHPPSKKAKKTLVVATKPSTTVEASTSRQHERPSTSRDDSSSGIGHAPVNADLTNDSDCDSDNEVCCQCQLREPEEDDNSDSYVFVLWAECTHPSCGHWTHLRFCTTVTFVRTDSEFWCPCHNEKEE